MKKILLISLILLGCSAKTAPQFELLEGGSIDLQSPQKLVLINYWAIWCAPCRKEIPEFNQLLAEQGDNIAVLAVNFDGSQGQQLRDEIAKLGIEFPSLLQDPRSMGSRASTGTAGNTNNWARWAAVTSIDRAADVRVIRGAVIVLL